MSCSAIIMTVSLVAHSHVLYMIDKCTDMNSSEKTIDAGSRIRKKLNINLTQFETLTARTRPYFLAFIVTFVVNCL